MNEIITFSIVALMLVISPGPNGVLIVKTASIYGKKPAFANIVGLTAATFFHGALSIFGISALLFQSENIFFVVKFIGAVYLFYIGAKSIYISYKKQDSISKIEQEIKNKSLAKYSREGFLTQILNPKVSMFYLAAFPQFMSFENPSYSNAFMLVAIHASIIFFWFVGMTGLISKLKGFSESSSLSLWTQRISGFVMICFSFLLLSTENKG